MITENTKSHRKLKNEILDTDLAIIGGGMAGTCCAITAARQGIKVVLVQDRPVLGGNASSEVRLWILGATSHMGNNNRWAREGGVIDEILVENVYRNPEGNTLILDTILLEKIWAEPNITLLLNTAAYDVIKSSANRIDGIKAFCSQNSTEYTINAPLFCDASGDGIIGFMSGAAFRMGAESSDEFGEPFAPDKAYGELLGHSIYFMSKDVGKPVKFVPPAYALQDITKIPRYRKFNVEEHGCWLWWLEYGGRLDTVHESEVIKEELWKVVYGVWHYIKNSGKFPEAENMTLEWVGQIPGKRESRRFEGHYMMKQSDIVDQVRFHDAVAHGGWAIDLHPADGVFSEKPGCNQWHSKGVYEIPYRSMISKNMDNLFLAGRIISASHVAFGSTRVMATCAHAAQAVGIAAFLALENTCDPAGLLDQTRLQKLQQELLKSGQYIPHLALDDPADLMQHIHSISPVPGVPHQHPPGVMMASSSLHLSEIPFNSEYKPLEFGTAQLLPLPAGKVPRFEVEVEAQEETTLEVNLRISSKVFNYTPDTDIYHLEVPLKKGRKRVAIEPPVKLQENCYAFLCFEKNPNVLLRRSKARITGLVTVFNKQNIAVSNYGRQDPDPDLGFESFAFWVPMRRPDGENIAMTITPGLTCFGPENICNGYHRPYLQPNAWIAAFSDVQPELTFDWQEEWKISRLVLSFDTDWDYAMESSLLGHAERIMPFTVRRYEVLDENGTLLHAVQDNHQTRNEIHFEQPVITRKITLRFFQASPDVPVSLFGLQIY